MTNTAQSRFPFFSLQPRIRILHFSWIAFFVSFVVWFNHAPLMAAIRDSLGLSKQEVAALLALNVALTIPARILVGILVDKLGPRVMFSALLAISGVICLAFALAQGFASLAITRFLLGIAGAGFVVGIRIIGEWYPARETGLAQGLYAGLGNFGSAAAAVTLPAIAIAFGGPDGWRWAVGCTGVLAIGYAGIYYLSVTDMPKGSTYFSPKKMGAMEVSSKADFFLYCIMQAPIAATLALLTYKLGPAALNVLSTTNVNIIYAGLGSLYAAQLYDTWRINKGIF